MKVLVFSDPHNADNAPRARRSDYREVILDKQARLIPKARLCDIVICTGDVFHSKRSENVSYYLTNKLCEIYREFPRMFIVPGNHDIDTKMDWSDRPLGILAKLPNVTILHDFSWMDGALRIEGWGGGEFFPYEKFKERYFGNYRKTDFPGSILVAHVPLAVGVYQFPVYDPHTLENHPFLVLGHIHNYQEASDNLLATGSLSRMVLNFDEFPRPVCYGIMEWNVDHWDSHLEELDVEPFEDVFFVEQRLKEKERDQKVAEFVDFVSNFDLPKMVSVEDIVAYLKGAEEISEVVRKKALSILEGL